MKLITNGLSEKKNYKVNGFLIGLTKYKLVEFPPRKVGDCIFQ